MSPMLAARLFLLLVRLLARWECSYLPRGDLTRCDSAWCWQRHRINYSMDEQVLDVHASHRRLPLVGNTRHIVPTIVDELNLLIIFRMLIQEGAMILHTWIPLSK